MALLRVFVCALLCGALLGACEDPPPAGDGGLPDAGAVPMDGDVMDGDVMDGDVMDGGTITPPMCDGLVRVQMPPVCTPETTDYAPGVDDTWAACVSDDGNYNRVEPDISSIARVMAFDEMDSLFDPSRDPSAMEFLEARLIYQRDQGIDSRVVRRYDPHYSVPDGTDCTLAGVPAMFPDYCVGPAQLGPRILTAFAAGIDGSGDEIARVHAARIEASLLIFFAVSTYKESFTCTTTAKDCDSAWAYYTGGEPVSGGFGLAGAVLAADPAAHQRAWDGALAVRCWRDLDPAETATDLVMRELARTQYDRAITDGLAGVLRARLVAACDADDGELLYQWAFARVVGDFLARAAQERDATQAGVLATAFANASPGDADVAAVVDALDALFDCP